MIKLAKPVFHQSDIERVVKVISGGNLVQGYWASKVEDVLHRYIGLKCAALVSSGTSALHLSLMGIGIAKGDAVLCPSFTYPATANAIELCGGTPIFIDIDPVTYVVTADAVEKSIVNYKGKEKLKALMLVHEFGYPCDSMAIKEICNKHNLRLIEDAACALGTRHNNGQHVGSYSDVVCFSFHPRKIITCGEGGAILTNDNDLYKTIITLRNHGMNRKKNDVNFILAGFNYRITDIQSALLFGPLLRIEEEVLRRRELARIYREYLSDATDIVLPSDHDGHSYQTYMIKLKDEKKRNRVKNALMRKGIESNIGAYSVPHQAYYVEKYGHKKEHYKMGQESYKCGLAVPLHGNLKSSDISYISEQIRRSI